MFPGPRTYSASGCGAISAWGLSRGDRRPPTGHPPNSHNHNALGCLTRIATGGTRRRVTPGIRLPTSGLPRAQQFQREEKNCPGRCFDCRLVRQAAWHYLSIRTVVDPVVPPADAEIVTLPSFNARTRPVLLTVARFVFELLQLNWTPVITLLDASYAVAVN